ncbi:MAG TPA: imelysin family protein, partial [Methyloceanibacter sp.]|nr:imelysin family protein [Methyloceanibacter sp.]
MSMTMRAVSALLFGALLLSPAPARAEADQAAIAEAALTKVIRPGYAELTKATAALDKDVRSLCGQPSAAAMEKTKESFAEAVAVWSRVEILRFGPILQDRRYERIFYWPDPKGIGLR